jgi:hypothetical protein
MTVPTPEPEFTIRIDCLTCGKEVFGLVTKSEDEAKEGFARALTASELHDCKSSPK